MAVGRTTVREVRRRAGACCEYCLLPEDELTYRFEIDHITPIKHGGEDSLDNLCLACGQCNGFKGPNLAGRDPLSGEIAALYDPRRQDWADHFAILENGSLNGLSPEGRATVYVLRMNSESRIAIRNYLMTVGRYPCLKT